MLLSRISLTRYNKFGATGVTTYMSPVDLFIQRTTPGKKYYITLVHCHRKKEYLPNPTHSHKLLLQETHNAITLALIMSNDSFWVNLKSSSFFM